jgi:hypothetical protein
MNKTRAWPAFFFACRNGSAMFIICLELESFIRRIAEDMAIELFQ